MKTMTIKEAIEMVNNSFPTIFAKEDEKSNKYIFIKFSRRKKIKKEKDFFDTKHGHALFTIHNLYGINY